MKRSSVGALMVLLVSATTAMAADRYAVDPAHTTVGFAVQHLVISHVNGAFPEVSGTILYDAEDITKSSVDVTINAASINTNVADRDTHLRSADFLDVATHPTITFKSTRLERQGEGVVCRGTLTIRGVSKEVAIPFAILGTVKDPWGNTKLGVEGRLTINRRDFGVTWSKTMDNGGLVVGDTVKITLNVEATQQPS